MAIENFGEIIAEKIVKKVNSKGEVRKKKVCPAGFKLSDGKCVKISGSEKISKTKSIRQSVKTKHASGEGYKAKIARKANKAKKKREQMGIK